MLHFCGGVRELLLELIDAGLDAINPVQISCARMDARELKAEFGKDMIFCGGGCDTQTILPYGTRKRCVGTLPNKCGSSESWGRLHLRASTQYHCPRPTLKCCGHVRDRPASGRIGLADSGIHDGSGGLGELWLRRRGGAALAH